jgi:ABC-type polysaccharide transport system permease subunit
MVVSMLNILFSVVPVVFAIMLSQIKYKYYFRTVQTLASIPNFISWVLVYSVIFYLIGSEQSGLNRLLIGLGLLSKPVGLLTNVRFAWIVQVGITLWKNAGYSAIIYLAAISSIDQELYQAADVDGASRFQKIVHVTIPGITATYFVLLLLAISNMLSNGFEQYWLFGNSTTWDALEVFDTYVYRMGIMNSEYSFATALGIFKTIVSIVLLTTANTLSKFIRGESIF